MKFRIQLPPNRLIVPPAGPKNAKIALVGEQPGRMEIQSGKPFVGPAGQVLDSCLHNADIVRSECYLTNVVKDLNRPIRDYINLEKKPLVSDEGKIYIDFLKQELSQVAPNIIVAVGGVALYALTERVGITKWRGSLLQVEIEGLPYKVISTMHPATVLPPKDVYLNTHLIVMDLKRAKKEAEFHEMREKERIILIGPTFDDSLNFLGRVREIGLEGGIIDFDIEVVNHCLSCISFATSPTEAISIPFTGGGGDYFTASQEAHVMRMIGEILEDERIPKRGQNVGFDIQFLMREYGIVTRGDIHDTMIAQKISTPDYRAGLDFITSVHTELPYYKAEGKKWLKVGGTWESFWQYNALDSVACAEAHPNQMKDLISQGNVETYDRQRRLISPLVYMMGRGIKVNVDEMLLARDRETAEYNELLSDFHRVHPGINPASPKQLRELFYDRQGHKPYVDRKTKKPTVNEEALIRLARKGIDEAKIILDLRRLQKRIGTYLNLEKVDNDGRYRSSYNPVGTQTGRLSSSQNIFGTGGNQQNWPHDLLRYLVPDEGYLFYSLDLSQVENRIVAYVGGVDNMIHAFESGIDLHRQTASLIFNKPIDQISDEPGSCSLGGGVYSERFWGKKANHGLNYDLGYRSFAMYYEIMERDAKFIVERYHHVYPEVRSGYHTHIRSMLSRNRTVSNLMGRNRLFMDRWGDKMFKEAYAHLPQSTTADIINSRGINYLYYNQDLFHSLELLNQIHDSIGFQIPLPPAVSWESAAKMIILLRNSLETPLRFKNREFIVPADLTIGLNLCKDDGKELKGGRFPREVPQLAEKLESIYKEILYV